MIQEVERESITGRKTVFWQELYPGERLQRSRKAPELWVCWGIKGIHMYTLTEREKLNIWGGGPKMEEE